ncbi:MAG: hypothetical protein PHD53_00040 [Methylococcales bacterium]|nr:hypothetical protein [Methylococcales bacterium]
MSKGTVQLGRHEGMRTRVYKCSEGHDTIGKGYNLDANPVRISNREIVNLYKNGITEERAEELLLVQWEELERDAIKRYSWFEKLNEARRAVVLNMEFNVGLQKFLNFKKTIQFISVGDFDGAAKEMLNSRWADQVDPIRGDFKGRADELALQMKTGEFI